MRHTEFPVCNVRNKFSLESGDSNLQFHTETTQSTQSGSQYMTPIKALKVQCVTFMGIYWQE